MEPRIRQEALGIGLDCSLSANFVLNGKNRAKPIGSLLPFPVQSKNRQQRLWNTDGENQHQTDKMIIYKDLFEECSYNLVILHLIFDFLGTSNILLIVISVILWGYYRRINVSMIQTKCFDKMPKCCQQSWNPV